MELGTNELHINVSLLREVLLAFCYIRDKLRLRIIEVYLFLYVGYEHDKMKAKIFKSVATFCI